MSVAPPSSIMSQLGLGTEKAMDRIRKNNLPSSRTARGTRKRPGTVPVSRPVSPTVSAIVDDNWCEKSPFRSPSEASAIIRGGTDRKIRKK
jgi:hypothetical protein